MKLHIMEEMDSEFEEKRKYLQQNLSKIDCTDVDFDVSELDNFDKQVFYKLHSAIFDAFGGSFWIDRWVPVTFETSQGRMPTAVMYNTKSSLTLVPLNNAIQIKLTKGGNKTVDKPLSKKHGIETLYYIVKSILEED